MSLNHPISLGMVGRRELAGDAEGACEVTPQVRGELTASVRDDGVRDPEPGHPVAQKGSGTCPGGDVSQGDRLQPPGITVDNGEKILVSLGLWERANDVEMQSREAMVRDIQGHEGRPSMAGNLGGLARKTRPAESLDGRSHPLPKVAPPEVAKGRVSAVMCQTMVVPKKPRDQGLGNDGARRGRGLGQVAQDPRVIR